MFSSSRFLIAKHILFLFFLNNRYICQIRPKSVLELLSRLKYFLME